MFSVLPRPFWRIGPISLTYGRDIGRYAFRMYSASVQLIGASVSEPPLVDSTDALSRYIYIYIDI